MSYALRITNSAEELAGFWERLKGAALRYVAYEHTDGKRTHCHAYVVGCTVSTDTLKNWVKKALGLTTYPKSDWAFATTTKDGKPLDDGFIVYMTKGKYDPAYNHQFADEDLANAKAKWIDYTAKLSSRKGELKPEKVNQQALMDECIKRYNAQTERLDHLGVDRVLDVIVDIVKQVVYKENKCIVGRFKFRDFCDYVLAHVFDDYQWRQVKKEFIRYR